MQQDINDEALFEKEQEHISDALGTIQRSLIATDVVDCEECGDPIGEERKAVLPSAKHCIYCASILEKKK